MYKKLITNFDQDMGKLAIFEMCMDNCDVGSLENEWPNNMISNKTIVYENGVISKKGKKIIHKVDPLEIDLCKRLAAESCTLMNGVMMESEATAPINEFYIIANTDAPIHERIDESLIFSVFHDTLFPLTTIIVEPIKEEGFFWNDVIYTDDDTDGTFMGPWKKLMAWFNKNSYFKSSAFVSIGDVDKLENIPDEELPSGTELTPSALPRLVLGVTKNGSLVGIFSYVVWT